MKKLLYICGCVVLIWFVWSWVEGAGPECNTHIGQAHYNFHKTKRKEMLGVLLVVGTLISAPWIIVARVRRAKEKDLIERITADYSTFESFKANYPEWSSLSYKIKNRIKVFYKQ